MPADQPLLLWASLPPSACLKLQGIWDPQSPMAEGGVRTRERRPKGQAQSVLLTRPSCLHPWPRARARTTGSLGSDLGNLSSPRGPVS